MSERFHFDAGAAGYDRGFGSVSPEFIPALLRAAKLTAGQRVLDVATGSGLAAQAACGDRWTVGSRRRDGHLRSDSGSSAAATCGVGERVGGDRRWSSSEFPRGELRRGALQHGLDAISEPRARIVGILPGGAQGRVRGGLGGHDLRRSFVARVSAAIGRHVPSKARRGPVLLAGRCRAASRLFETAGFRGRDDLGDSPVSVLFFQCLLRAHRGGLGQHRV